ncbi:hypothetical protein [Marinomonas balearica]|uniref:Flagellar hook-length control protein FliK n=1 Tax=Marinomonas balearica TaxID=491947 RepID=A0A4R6M9Q8_9GAMM|nr:hypothetical protein [Marinomonas balearica]TDO98247.1 hypothetical protein DFP79_1888 [Marinomonas balearica]
MSPVSQSAESKCELDAVYSNKVTLSDDSTQVAFNSSSEWTVEDNLAFTALLASCPDSPQMEQTPLSGSTAPTVPLTTQQLSAIGSAIQSQIPEAPEGDEFECNILMPHLGEVQLDAKLKQDTWHMNLSFVRAEAFLLARQQSQFLSQRLQQKMGKAVVLGLSLKEG